MTPLLSITMFMVVGLMFVLANMTLGRLFRPHAPNAEKLSIYECGEPSLGNNWVQFDLRFHMVALLFLVFDVELALMYPWAVAFRDMPGVALVLALPFIGLIIVGYAYEWFAGSLEWVRSSLSHLQTPDAPSRPGPLSSLARIDPETLTETPFGARDARSI